MKSHYIQGNFDRQNFKAKFVHTDDLKAVVEYSIAHNKFDKLNQARKNIGQYFLTRRIKFELFETVDKKPFVIFTRYTPKDGKIIPRFAEDYIISEPIIFQSSKKMNPLKYGYEIIKKMGSSVPDNKIFKEVVSGIIQKKQ